MTPRQWRVPITVPAAKWAVAAVLLVATVTIARDLTGAVVGLLVAAGLGLSGVRDVVVPVRLQADADGLSVFVGPVGRQRSYPWSAIERIRVDERRRFLGRSTLLEIDVESELYFLGRYELGATPAEVLEDLENAERSRSQSDQDR
ncbi:PH domain-containing protein [Cryptosporangium phraense]|uniref:PH domain-containing protein n=1 Tax=Cryptosporangium phraense TaxID=2593070 RepID=A0A545AJF2_9ACTN|nr:PH domain-containing protein [Cryptosporangium phraense]TQS41439.1 PH domain-containing protein [Cryptosporangium phraense]